MARPEQAGQLSLPPKLRFATLERYGFACVYCGRRPPEVALHVDHLVARARGGTDDAANLVVACKDCNLGKSDSFISYQGADTARVPIHNCPLCATPTAFVLPRMRCRGCDASLIGGRIPQEGVTIVDRENTWIWIDSAWTYFQPEAS